MKRRTVTYITKKVSGESYKAYVPSKLPPVPAIKLEGLYGLLEKATLMLAELNNIARSISNISVISFL